jgi:outer membrane protein TolC
MSWDTKVELSEDVLPFLPLKTDIHELVSGAFQHNPNWAQLELGLQVAEAGLQEAKSRHFPTVALIGTIRHLVQTDDIGYMTDSNRDILAIGITMEFPLFKGFRTRQEIHEATARIEKLRHEQFLLSEGIALQVKDTSLQIERAQQQIQALQESLDAAAENRELNIRAYQSELADTQDVIEAQLLESVIKGQYLNALYDHVVHRAKLDYLIGHDMAKQLFP